MTINTNSNPSLPEEIIYDILSRLPVKSLLRLRSVSKLWLSLISSSQFVKSHLSKSIENTQFTHHKLIVSFPYPDFDLKTCSVYSLFNDPVSEAIELDYPMKYSNNSVCVLGSCNGLVCLLINDRYLFFWNPSTRKSKLVYSDMNLQYGHYLVYGFGYGFGYDECNDDYKVVLIFCVYGDGVCETKVEVYSSRFRCRRRIREFPFSEPLDDCGKFTSGALHWAANSDSSDSWVIVSLDLKEETYGEVLQPKYEEGNYDLILGILSGQLCVLCNYEKSRANIWIMKEYGVKESWMKLVTIPYMDSPLSYEYLTPLHISENGDILLEYEACIQLYDSKDKTFRNLEFTDISDCLEAGTYIESLVSPISRGSA